MVSCPVKVPLVSFDSYNVANIKDQMHKYEIFRQHIRSTVKNVRISIKTIE